MSRTSTLSLGGHIAPSSHKPPALVSLSRGRFKQGPWGAQDFEAAFEETESITPGTPRPTSDLYQTAESIKRQLCDPCLEIPLLPKDAQLLLHLRHQAGFCNDSIDGDSQCLFITMLKLVDCILGIERTSYTPCEIRVALRISEQMIGIPPDSNDQESKHRYMMVCDSGSGRRNSTVKRIHRNRVEEFEKAERFLKAEFPKVEDAKVEDAKVAAEHIEEGGKILRNEFFKAQARKPYESTPSSA